MVGECHPALATAAERRQLHGDGERSDASGNPVQASQPLTVDTTADVAPPLAVSVSGHLINKSEKTAVGFTVAGLTPTPPADVTFTDAGNQR